MSYRVQSADTSYEAEQVQIAIFRRRGEAGRGELMQSLTNTTRAMSWHNFLNQSANKTRLDCALLYVRLLYGEELARGLATHLEQRARSDTSFSENKLLSSQEMFSSLSKVIDVLDELGVPYLIAGSVASSIHGISRSTADANIVVNFKPEHVAPFIARLQDNYYISETAIEDALKHCSSFNVIHFETGFKLDLIILKSDQFNQTSFSRAILAPISISDPRQFRLNTPENVLLQKLRWYQAGGQVSDKQWLDILGVLKTKEQLDFSYLEEWADKLNLTDLLSKARDEAGR